MNNAAAVHELNRALAHFRRRQDTTPTPHSAREIAQIAMFAEYLYGSHTAPHCEGAMQSTPSLSLYEKAA